MYVASAMVKIPVINEYLTSKTSGRYSETRKRSIRRFDNFALDEGLCAPKQKSAARNYKEKVDL